MHISLTWPWARRWINHNSLWHMASATPDLWLPSQSQSDSYRIILLGDRGTCVWTTCPRSLHDSETAGSWTLFKWPLFHDNLDKKKRKEKVNLLGSNPEYFEYQHWNKSALSLWFVIIKSPRPHGAMQLRTRGHDFELPIIKYEFNKQNFIVQSLFNYVRFCVLLYYLHFVLYCTHVRM